MGRRALRCEPRLSPRAPAHATVREIHAAGIVSPLDAANLTANLIEQSDAGHHASAQLDDAAYGESVLGSQRGIELQQLRLREKRGERIVHIVLNACRSFPEGGEPSFAAPRGSTSVVVPATRTALMGSRPM